MLTLLSVCIVLLIICGFIAAYLFLPLPDYGFIDKKGRVVFSASNLTLLDKQFSDGLLRVRGYFDYYQFWNSQGKLAFSSKHPIGNARRFSEGLCAIRSESNHKWGFIDESGNYVVEPKYSDVSSFSEGFAPVCLGAKWGFIDKSGRLTIEPQFEYVLPFCDGLAAVLYKGLIGFVDHSGHFAIEPRFHQVSSFADGLAIVTLKEGLQELHRSLVIDKDGNSVFDLYQTRQTYTPESTDRTSGKLYGLSEGEIGVDASSFSGCEAPKFWKRFGKFSEGLLSFGTGRKIGYLDRDGKLVIARQFEQAGPFVDGMAKAKVNGKYGFINKQGKFMVSPQFFWASDFSEGFAVVATQDNKYGFIDKTGKFVIEPKFNGANPFAGGLARIGLNPTFDSVGRIPFP